MTLCADLRERGIGPHVIERGMDTATMEGRAMFGMLSVRAELQRELIVANTNEGLASARTRGQVGGRRTRADGRSRPVRRGPSGHPIGPWSIAGPYRRAERGVTS
ncbi:recombinase family protein [Streptomyces sp. NBC_00873]|uniref:recombinase family protein n=1 Tax=Streptomyces sp. NBC_00873 TaxID=2975852 RepID=UPI0038648938|nr:recombinase family protein [Streptomyces sp. NBC_00873]